MFLQASVILLTGGRGYTPRADTPWSRHPPGADITLPEQTPLEQTPPPRADTPLGADTPPGADPPGADPPGADPPPRSRPPRADTPLGADCPGADTTPPRPACCEIRSSAGGTHPTGMQSCSCKVFLSTCLTGVNHCRNPSFHHTLMPTMVTICVVMTIISLPGMLCSVANRLHHHG